MDRDRTDEAPAPTEDLGLPTPPSPGRLPPPHLPPHRTPIWLRAMPAPSARTVRMGKDAAQTSKPRLVGVNHVALEVGDLEEALKFYGAIFSFNLRGRAEGMAFLDMGDQFLALAETLAAAARPSDYRPDAHFGLVVDDRPRAKELAEAAGARLIEGGFLDFLDPWGNRIEVVGYADVQFTKAPAVQAGMGLALGKSEKARGQLADKGMSAGADEYLRRPDLHQVRRAAQRRQPHQAVRPRGQPHPRRAC